MDPYTDEALIAHLRTGDRKAFLFLYEKYKVGLYHYCLRLLHDEPSAEDAVQQTFERVFSKSATLANPALLRSWIYTIARNEAFGLMRKKNPEFRIDDDCVSTDPTALEAIEHEESIDLVRRTIDALSPAYREVILLREYEGASYDEIARITNSTLGAVKSKLFKARSVLMERIRTTV